MSLNPAAVNEIIDLLLPLIDGEQKRRALLFQALGNASILSIDYSGDERTFAAQIVKALADFGEIEPGKLTLWVLLETCRSQVGLDKQNRIDDLQNIVNIPQVDIAIPTCFSRQADVPP